MHKALYRKWRPQIFDDVYGQEHITSVLRYEVENGGISHAYLFCGSRGTGKTTCAKILAKAINCEHPQNGNPCGKCPACLSLENGSATDVLEMDAASNNGVDNIRNIRDEVIYSPAQLRYRVYIVDEVHMLSSSAFNALLKTLEEPPAHVVFILATTELQKLPATIVSRCQRFDFHRIPVPALTERISFIAREENMELDPAAAERIARMAQGGMRDAISLLELCGSAGKKIDLAAVNEMTGSAGREETVRLLEAVQRADYDALFAAVAEAVASARDLTVFWQDLIALYRDVLVMKTTDAAAQYLDLTDAEITALSALAKGFTRGQILAHCKLLEDALFAMGKADASKRMIAELTLVRLCDPTLDTSAESLLSRLEKVEAAVSAAYYQKPAPAGEKPAEPPKAAPTPERPAPAKEKKPEEPPAALKKPAAPDGGRVLRRFRGFAECVENVRRENPLVASFLTNASALVAEDGHVVLQLPNAFAESMVSREGGVAAVARALSAGLRREVRPEDVTLEIPDPAAAKKDTVLDDILTAAGEDPQ